MLPYPGEYVKKQKYYNFKKITIANFLKMCNNIKCKINRGVAQFGRAPRSGRGGRKFKSCHLDQKKQDTVWYPVFCIVCTIWGTSNGKALFCFSILGSAKVMLIC